MQDDDRIDVHVEVKGGRLEAGSTLVGSHIYLGPSKEAMDQLLSHMQQLESELSVGAADAQRQILNQFIGEEYLQTFWFFFLGHVETLFQRFGRGTQARVALIGEGFGEADRNVQFQLGIKDTVAFVTGEQPNAMNIFLIAAVNAIAPEVEIYYLQALPGRKSDLIRAMGWCLDNAIDIVAILAAIPRFCEDGTCPICQAARSLVERGITVVASDQGCPNAVADGMITVGGLVPDEEQGLVLLRRESGSPLSAKVFTYARMQAENITAVTAAGGRPLVIRNIQDLTSEALPVAIVSGLLSVLSAYFKKGGKSATPADLDRYLAQSSMQITTAAGVGAEPKPVNCLLKPEKILDLPI
ncbi:MAG: hypothetical protein ABSC17_06055 [Thermacetogeniaceae bacterium]